VYEVWRRDSASALPILNSHVQLEKAGEKPRYEKFLGFGWRSVLVPGPRGSISELPLSSFDTLRTNSGATISSSAITEMRFAHTPPCRTGIILRMHGAGVDAEFARVSSDNRDGTRFVPADAIQAIVIRGTVAHPAVFFLVGLALDTVAGVALVGAWREATEPKCYDIQLPSGALYAAGALEPLDREVDLRTGIPVPLVTGAAHSRGPAAAAP
jgi:hypothetical protein